MGRVDAIAEPRREVDDRGRRARRRRDALPLLETLRQYGEDRLEELGEADTWRRRHAEHFADVRRGSRARAWSARTSSSWRPRLHAELDNLRAAVTWALDRDGADAELGARIIAATRRGRPTAGDVIGVTTWAERAIDAARASTPVCAATCWSRRAGRALNRGDIEQTSALAARGARGGPSRADATVAGRAVRAARIRADDPRRPRGRGAQAARTQASADGRAWPRRRPRGPRHRAAGWRFFAGDVEGARAEAVEPFALCTRARVDRRRSRWPVHGRHVLARRSVRALHPCSTRHRARRVGCGAAEDAVPRFMLAVQAAGADARRGDAAGACAALPRRVLELGSAQGRPADARDRCSVTRFRSFTSSAPSRPWRSMGGAAYEAARVPAERPATRGRRAPRRVTKPSQRAR